MSSQKIRAFLNKSNHNSHNFNNGNNANNGNNGNNQIMQKYLKDNSKISVEIPATRTTSSEHLEINEFSKKPEDFLYKSIIFYGPSGSGKTQLIRHFMYEMRHLFPRVFVFCPTNLETHDYSNIVPDPMIFESFTIENIRSIFECQKAIANVYHMANDLSIIRRLFEKVADITHRQHIANLQKHKKTGLQNTSSINQKNQIKETFTRKALEFMKNTVIKPNEKKLRNMSLENDELIALNNLNTNPNLLIIFDDAITELSEIIKQGNKTNNPVIQEFFFRARHSFITHFYSLQDDKGFPSDLRKNCFVNMFTKYEVTNATFTRKSNDYDKQTSVRGPVIAREIFKYMDNDNVDPKLKYRKLIYYRDTGKFEYITANIHNDFRVCSPYVWEFCKKIQKDPREVDKSNPFLQKFMK